MEAFVTWLNSPIDTLGRRLLFAFALLVVGLAVMKGLMSLVRRALSHTKLEKASRSFLLSTIRGCALVLLGLMLASSLGVDVTGIVALASVLTLALSLALQSLLSNVVGGLLLMSLHPFRTGDFVQLGDQSGTALKLGLVYTRLLAPDNRVISIPNSVAASAQLVNFTQAGTRRVEVQVQVPYSQEPQRVIDALVVAGTMDNVLLEPTPFAAIEAFGDSAIVYILRVWAKAPDYWEVYYALNSRIHRVFQEQHIPFAYPRLEVQVVER